MEMDVSSYSNRSVIISLGHKHNQFFPVLQELQYYYTIYICRIENVPSLAAASGSETLEDNNACPVPVWNKYSWSFVIKCELETKP